MRPWVSPVPGGVGAQARVFRPGRDLRIVADVVCERAWKGPGVRVFRWPCGTVAIVRVGGRGDDVLLRECVAFLLVTYSCVGPDAKGPSLVDVLHELSWAEATAA